MSSTTIIQKKYCIWNNKSKVNLCIDIIIEAWIYCNDYEFHFVRLDTYWSEMELNRIQSFFISVHTGSAHTRSASNLLLLSVWCWLKLSARTLLTKTKVCSLLRQIARARGCLLLPRLSSSLHSWVLTTESRVKKQMVWPRYFEYY